MEPEVLLEERGPLGLVTLNRPRALNALGLGMIRTIRERLDAWEAAARVQAVVIRGAGGKAFCAGGDVRAVATTPGGSAAPGEEPLSRAFFREEYGLNHRIHHYRKPFIALVDGICMGGGLGLSMHGSHRVVTERLTLAMPETAIGFFPDVGGGWFLPRFPGESGTYLGLTGARCTAADALWLGYGTHAVPHGQLEAVLEALLAAPWGGGPARQVASRVLEGFATELGPSELAARRQQVDRCFAGNRVAQVLQALEAEPGEWASGVRQVLGRMSPTSLEVTLQLLRRGRQLSYDEVAGLEWKLSQALAARADFREGIRAVLVDKDHRPRWQPAHLEEVREEEVEACFSPPGVEPWLPDAPTGSGRG